jgi:uncharacterized membrane-anchored protein YjiN (DUF445 family)
MDLQRFAEESGDNKDTNTDNTETKITDTKDKDEKLFTQEDIEKIISKRLDRERKKSEEEKVEAERLAKMSAEERAKAEFEKEKSKFEEERQQHQREKLELQVTKELANKELPTEFSKYLIGADAETCMNNIKEFETTWQKAIEKSVDSKLKGSTPKAGSGDTSQSSTSTGFVNIIKQNQAKR